MISIDQIVTSNLEMLKEQEASLLNSLDLVQRAITLFESQGSSNGRKSWGRGRPAERRRGRRPGSTNKNGTHLERIIVALKASKAPLSSRELIDTLFKQQNEYKDRTQFRQLMYPTLTNAYKKGVLKRKQKKIHIR